MPRQRVALTPALTGLLRESRTKLRLSQVQAASLAGISPTWWRRIEGGNRPKGDAEMQTIAGMLAALGVDEAEIIAVAGNGIANAIARIKRDDPGHKRALYALVEGLSSEEAAAVVAFISTLRRISDDRRRIPDHDAGRREPEATG